MSLSRFFCERDPQGDSLRLGGDEFHHLKNVRRTVAGDRVEIVNGRGRLIEGEVAHLRPREAVIAVIRVKETPAPVPRLFIAPALTKPQAMNWMIEKLCELGVDEIRPLLTERTDAPWSAAALRRWRKIAAQALKVNRRLWLTRVAEPVPLDSLGADTDGVPPAGKLFLECGGDRSAARNWELPALALIGPPGDFSSGEKESLRRRGFRGIAINDCILRTETAALAIAAIIEYD